MKFSEMPRDSLRLLMARDREGLCVHCGERPQKNGNWCWQCSDEAAAGQHGWDDLPRTQVAS